MADPDAQVGKTERTLGEVCHGMDIFSVRF